MLGVLAGLEVVINLAFAIIGIMGRAEKFKAKAFIFADIFAQLLAEITIDMTDKANLKTWLAVIAFTDTAQHKDAGRTPICTIINLALDGFFIKRHGLTEAGI